MAATAPVIVTRPEREAALWVQQLGARGIDASALPLIAIAPCADAAARQALRAARARIGQRARGAGRAAYGALMFVSANAVAHFFDCNPDTPDALISTAFVATKMRAWAAGPGTAAALLRAGVPPAQIDAPAPGAAQFDSEALWQQVAQQVRPGMRVLIVRGCSRPGGGAGGGSTMGGADQAGGMGRNDSGDATGNGIDAIAGANAIAGSAATQGTGRDWLARQIGAAGGQVDWLAAYQRSAAPLSAAQRAQAAQAAQAGALWLLCSADAVRHLAALLSPRQRAAARALTTHPRIAQVASAAGFGRVRSCRPGLADVLASIESGA